MTSVEVVLFFVDPCRGVPESDTDSSVVFVCKDDNRYVYYDLTVYQYHSSPCLVVVQCLLICRYLWDWHLCANNYIQAWGGEEGYFRQHTCIKVLSIKYVCGH